MKRFITIAVVAIGLALTACGTSESSYQPPAEPTRIVIPTREPIPKPLASVCISWTEAYSHIGENTCVSGMVDSTYKDPNSSAFFINFDGTRTSFSSVSFKWVWDGLKGQCVEIYGKISTYRGRPQIVIENKDQLRGCRR